MPLFADPLPTFFFLPTSFRYSSALPSIVYVCNSGLFRRDCRNFFDLNLVAGIETRCLLFSSRGMFRDYSGNITRCKGFDSEGDFESEAEILELIKNSKEKPYPSERDLIDAGRDSTVARLKKANWLSLGLMLDEEEDVIVGYESFDEFSVSERAEGQKFDVASSSPSSCPGRSLERVADDESGIEGMLSRLEKERNAKFGVFSSDGNNDRSPKNPVNKTVVGLQGSSTTASQKTKDGNNMEGNLGPKSSSLGIDDLRGSVSPEMSRLWTTYGEELQDEDSRGFGIASNEGRIVEELDVSRIETLGSRIDSFKSKLGQEAINHNQIRKHLQHLELELSSIVCSLRSNTTVSHQGRSRSSSDMIKLFDAWEFQENEILNAKDKLRALRGKLAVAEGKMTLNIIDAKKLIKEKQMKINCARRALQLLRTSCVVWPNSASEVFLAGSFDGWASKRKMEKSSTGVFSFFLKLYPGRYEIKFIVDGQWKIDPLRPIVNIDGYENNLLIIT